MWQTKLTKERNIQMWKIWSKLFGWEYAHIKTYLGRSHTCRLTKLSDGRKTGIVNCSRFFITKDGVVSGCDYIDQLTLLNE